MPPSLPKKKNEFLSNVTKLSGAQFITLGLGFLTAPFFGRLFVPEEVGIFSVFMSLITLVTTFGTMRYELAVVLPEKDEDAINVWAAGALMLSSWVAILGLAVILGVGHLLEGTNYMAIVPFLWMVIVGITLGNLGALINQWLNRKKCYGANASSSITASVANQFGAIGAGALGHNSSLALIVVNLGSQVLGLAVKARVFVAETVTLWGKVRLRSIWAMMKRYRKFPLVELWSATLNTLSVHLAPLLLVYFYSPDIVGLYSQGMRLVQLPMILVGLAVGQVFYQQATEAKVNGTLPELVMKLMKGLVLVGGFPFLVLGLYGDTIFSILLGARWGEAGVYTQILAAWIFIVFCGAPLSSAYLVLERQGSLLLFNVITIIFRTVALIVGGLSGGPRLAIALYAIVGVILWLVFISNLFHLVKLPIFKTWVGNIRELFPAVFAAIPLLAVRQFITGASLQMVAVFCIALMYLAYMIWRHPLYRSSFDVLWNALRRRQT